MVIAMLELKTDLDAPNRHVTLHNLLYTPSLASLISRRQVSYFRRLYGARQAADYEEARIQREDANMLVEGSAGLCEDILRVIRNG